jgi:hypothetical protein
VKVKRIKEYVVLMIILQVGILPPQFYKQKLREQAEEADTRLRQMQDKDVKDMSDKEVLKKFTEEHAPS